MQSARSGGRDLGYLPSVYSPLPNLPPPEMGVSRGANFSGSDHLPGGSMTSLSWERRCVRKHRRRTDDVGCSAKRRKLMEEAESEPSDYPDPKPCWTMEDPTRPPLTRLGTEVLHSGPSSQEVGVAFSAPVRPESEGGCMEVEAAQRKLQEIEDRITLEDDSDEDLDVDPAQRRPVLVLSDSLREGLQRGIGDILPETVAQSVSRSCMELVLWRPPEDPLTQQLKDSIQRQQRKQQPACRQTPAPVPRTPVPDRLQPKPQPEPAFRSLYCPPVAPGGGEEEMELETFY